MVFARKSLTSLRFIRKQQTQWMDAGLNCAKITYIPSFAELPVALALAEIHLNMTAIEKKTHFTLWFRPRGSTAIFETCWKWMQTTNPVWREEGCYRSHKNDQDISRSNR